ncbi:hypothetical protein [Nocardia amamiensis]|uniref:hypothetical protein n=1 Tax=Nocardia amamiensis TaxID=404578 RepID=UPI0033EFF0A2
MAYVITRRCGRGDFSAFLQRRQPELIDRNGWRSIDRIERMSGASMKRPRVKFTTIELMIAAATWQLP